MYIIILGAPGAGKGTQAENIAKEMELTHISSGELFRQAVERGDELGIRVKDYINKGMLVPDEVTIKVILQRLMTDDYKNGVILDGFPRNIKQAKALDDVLKEKDKVIDKALYIKVSEEELTRRLMGRRACRKCQASNKGGNNAFGEGGKCKICGGELYQRADDNEETIKKRLSVYFKDTMPVIEYYRKQGKLLEIAGEDSVEVITERILNALRKREFIAK